MGGATSKLEEEEAPLGFPRFKGKVYFRGNGTDGEYLAHAYQYATTSLPGGMLAPSAIVYVEDDDDICAAVAYARAKRIAVAVRTGGHQYGGSSSTNGANIQIDLSGKEACHPALYPYHTWEYDADKSQVRAGVGLSLKKVSENCVRDRIFFPHGACSHVHLGGHVQTGGYGVITRQFGLFSDRILSVEVITADGLKRTVRRDATEDEERELFFALIGGSPGNLAVITHATIRVSRDADHANSRGLMCAFVYDTARMKGLIEAVTSLAEEDSPPDFSLTLCVYESPPIFSAYNQDTQMKLKHPHLYGPTFVNPPTSALAIIGCWANLEGEGQAYDASFFKRVCEIGGVPIALPGVFGFWDDKPLPMSYLMQQYAMPTVREYDLPYVKRCYVSNRQEFIPRGVPQWLTDRIEDIYAPTNGCKIVVQVMAIGPQDSGFHRLGSDGRTSVPFRDSTLWIEIDAFYDPTYEFLGCTPQATAQTWANSMDASAFGPNGVLGDQYRKLIWAPNGDRDLDRVRDLYFESEAVYQRILAVKRRIDPSHVFTANLFCVGASTAAKDRETL
jgi:FAD/FMN-containing dehydrogenase